VLITSLASVASGSAGLQSMTGAEGHQDKYNAVLHMLTLLLKVAATMTSIHMTNAYTCIVVGRRAVISDMSVQRVLWEILSLANTERV